MHAAPTSPLLSVSFEKPFDVGSLVEKGHFETSLAKKSFKEIHSIEIKNYALGIIAVGLDGDKERCYKIDKEKIKTLKNALENETSSASEIEEALQNIILAILKQPD